MKRICSIGFLFLFLLGCGKETTGLDRIMSFRDDILRGGCTFTTEVKADYDQVVQTFEMRCKCEQSGNITFEVTAPDSISGITGTLDMDGGKLTFDDHALMFPLLADGRLSPVSAPWIMMRALRAGYIAGCGKLENGFELHIDDSYQSDALQLMIRTDQACKPISADICYRGSRILALTVKDFTIL